MKLFKQEKLTLAQEKAKYERELVRLKEKQAVLKLKDEVRKLKHETGAVGALVSMGKGFTKGVKSVKESQGYKDAMSWRDNWEKNWGSGGTTSQPAQKKKKKKGTGDYPWLMG